MTSSIGTLTVVALVAVLVVPAAAVAQSEEQAGEEAAELVPPVLVSEVAADYPERALAEAVEAEVVLEIDIDAEGQVEGVSVLVPAEPTGYGFDEAAVEAVSQYEFEPATEAGIPVPVRITYRYRFALATGPATADAAPAGGTSPDEGGEAERAPVDAAADTVVNFRGQLLERGTRLPLTGVIVVVFRGEGDEARGFEATSDREGFFEFRDLEPGEWKVLAEPEGYYPLRTSEEIVSGQRTEATYYVEKGTYNPYDVLVEESRPRKEVSRTTLSVEEADRVPGTFGDVLRVVQNFPGVARPGPFGGQIIVRGSAPEDTAVFVDGVEVPIIYHFGGLRSVIPIGMLESLDFYPGNFSSYYGRATGGVVDVKLKDLRPEKVGGYADVNIVDAGVYVEAPLGDKLALAVAARRSYIDGILNAVVPDDSNVNLVTAPRYYDFQLLADFRPVPEHELKVFVFGSDDRLELLFENPAELTPDLLASDASTSTTFYRTVLEHSWVPDPTVRNVFKTSAGRNWVFFGVGDQLFLDLDNYVAQIRDTLYWSPSEDLTLMVGLDYLFSRSDARIKFPQLTKEGEPGGRPDFDTVRYTASKDTDYHSVGGFLEVEARVFDRLMLIPGVRFDYFSRVEETALAPRMAARLALTEKWTVKGGVGLYHQEPSFDETNETFGNPGLHLESAVHYSAGVEFKPLPYLTLDATGFYKDLRDLVSRTDATVERDGEIVPLNYNNGGVGRVYGLELLVRHEFANNFTGWIGYTLSRAERKDFGSDEWRLFDYDQTHILNILGTYELPRNWTLGFRWRLISGNPYTPRVGSVYMVDDGSYSPVNGEPNSGRLPLFHQLDIRIDKRWVFDTWIFSAYLDLQNVYNHANVEGFSYNYDSSQKRPQQGLPILPVLGIKGEF